MCMNLYSDIPWHSIIKTNIFSRHLVITGQENAELGILQEESKDLLESCFTGLCVEAAGLRRSDAETQPLLRANTGQSLLL